MYQELKDTVQGHSVIRKGQYLRKTGKVARTTLKQEDGLTI